MKHFVSSRGVRALALLAVLTGFATTPSVQAQSLSSLLYFNGAQPAGGVALGTDGVLYGVSSGSTLGGGATGGLIYRVTTNASHMQTLYQYGRLGVYTGLSPQAALVSDSAGAFYGVTAFTGVDSIYNREAGNGTIFKIDQGGGYTSLYSFTDFSTTTAPFINTDGARPTSTLLLANDGFLYGATRYGGANGTGALFKIAVGGTGFTTLHSFAAESGTVTPESSAAELLPINADGAYPRSRLVQGANGDLFGTAYTGGANGTGTIFTVRRDGTGFTVLHSFDASPPTITDTTDPNFGKPKLNGTGGYPFGGMVLASNGFLYGTTIALGGAGFGTIYRIGQDGSNFSVLKSFDGTTLGANPSGELIVALDGTVVGTTSTGGTTTAGVAGAGTLYSMSLDGATLTTLYVFGAEGGASPSFGVIQAADGSFYGTTREGGPYGLGVIFKFGTPTNAPAQGTPQPFDDGGGVLSYWLLATLIGLISVKAVLRKTSGQQREIARS